MGSLEVWLAVALLASICLAWRRGMVLSRQMALLRYISRAEDDVFDALDGRSAREKETLTLLESLVTRQKRRADAAHSAGLRLAQSALAEQVAHDMRSPAAALQLAIAGCRDIDAGHRELLQQVAQRIHDIATLLLARHRSPAPAAPPGAVAAPQDITLRPTVDAAVTRVREACRNRRRLHVALQEGPTDHAFFVRADATALEAVLVASLEAATCRVSDGGTVTVSMRRDGEAVSVSIQATGSPGPVTAAATGRELQAQRDVLQAWGGRLVVSTQPPRFCVDLRLARAPSPPWLMIRLDVGPGDTLVVLDDDESIHLMWRQRLAQLNVDARPKALVHLRTPEAFGHYIKTAPSECTYLVDYELADMPQTGLDLLEHSGVRPAVLVTSRTEEADLQARCTRLDVRLLGKERVASLPIAPRVRQERLDAVLIDDDVLVHDIWSFAAQTYTKTLRRFFRPSEFYEAAEGIDRRTPVYLDYTMGPDVDAVGEARKIEALGFEELYLATGHAAERLGQLPPCIRKVVGKNPPPVWDRPTDTTSR